MHFQHLSHPSLNLGEIVRSPWVRIWVTLPQFKNEKFFKVVGLLLFSVWPLCVKYHRFLIFNKFVNEEKRTVYCLKVLAWYIEESKWNIPTVLLLLLRRMEKRMTFAFGFLRKSSRINCFCQSDNMSWIFFVSINFFNKEQLIHFHHWRKRDSISFRRVCLIFHFTFWMSKSSKYCHTKSKPSKSEYLEDNLPNFVELWHWLS